MIVPKEGLHEILGKAYRTQVVIPAGLTVFIDGSTKEDAVAKGKATELFNGSYAIELHNESTRIVTDTSRLIALEITDKTLQEGTNVGTTEVTSHVRNIKVGRHIVELGRRYGTNSIQIARPMPES